MKIKIKLVYAVIVCFLLGSVVGAVSQQVLTFQAPLPRENPKSSTSTLYVMMQNANASFIIEPGKVISGVVDLGDINGDSMGDFLIYSNSVNQPYGISDGKMYIVFGKETWHSEERDLSTANGSFICENMDNEGIISVAGIGDVDGDGLNDVLVSVAKGTSAIGRAYLIFGKTSGWANNINLSTADASFITPPINSSFIIDFPGQSVSGVGDVNGDGYGDFIIGAPCEDEAQTKLFMFFGRPARWSSYPSWDRY